MAPNRRVDRVAEAIRIEAATFLNEGAKDPRLVGMVTVTAVDVTRDLRQARIFVSILGTDTERTATFEALTSLTSHLRSRIARSTMSCGGGGASKMTSPSGSSVVVVAPNRIVAR